MLVDALRGAVRLVRPSNALVSAAATYVGYAVAAAPLPPGFPAAPLLAAMAASVAFTAAGNIRNDLGDVDIDRAAHPDRPLVTGAMTPRAARVLAIAAYAAAVVAAWLVSWAALALVLVAIPLMEGYEQWGKGRGLPGNLLIALLTMAPFVIGGLAAQHVGPALLALAGLAALATLAREVIKDIQDADADAGARRTFVHRVGAVAAGRLARGALLAAVLLSPAPWALESVLGATYLAAIIPADVAFVLAAQKAVAQPRRAQQFAKLGMVAALLAILVGRTFGAPP